MGEMTETTWLMWAGAHGAARLRSELAARGANPRFVRAQTEAELVSLAVALPHESLGVALDARVVELDAVEGVVRTLRSIARVHEIFALAAAGDAGQIARLFCAGASEVITAEVAEASLDAECEARMGKGPICRHSGAASVGDDMRDGRMGCSLGAEGPEGAWACECGQNAHGADADGLDTRSGRCLDASAAMTFDGIDEEIPPWDESVGLRPSAPDPADMADGAAGAAGGGSVPGASGATRSAAATESAGAVHRAPVIVAISGRGGCGKTTVVASMAAAAARAGLRCAVLDFDLMFGNLADVFGVEAPIGLEAVVAHEREGQVQERDIEDAAMRIGPGLTLWGPCAEAERAELMARPAEQLVGALRGVADAIFVDTSGQWGDAVAMALGACDRCLVLGDAGAFSAVSARRAIEVAVRLGVPRARMSSVFNRMPMHGEGEEAALRFEMGVSLSSRLRIADGGSEVSGMLSFGHIDRMIAGQSAFAKSIRAATVEVLRELGCSLGTLEFEGEQAPRDRPRRLRLPWRCAGDER